MIAGLGRALGATGLVAIALTLGGCDDCKLGDGHCDGNHLFVCETGNDNQPVTYDQGSCDPGTCVEAVASGEPIAVCSTTGQPDARCAGASAANELCGDAQTVLHCAYGYAVDEACDVACVETGELAFCALSAMPDPRCAANAYAACTGDALVSCLDGYAVSQTPCGSLDPACVTAQGTDPSGDPEADAYCATSSAPDPRCAGSAYWCDGATAFACDAEGRSIAQACSSGSACTDWLSDEAVLDDAGYDGLIATCG